MPTAEYVRRPVVFTAIQYDGTNHDEVIAFCPWCEYDGATLRFNDPSTPDVGVKIDVSHWVMANEVGTWMPYLAPDFLNYYTIAPPNAKTAFLVKFE
jgi:uncharacterized protein CbrC (UPF0167 family)